MKPTIYYHHADTPVGPVLFVGTADTVMAMYWKVFARTPAVGLDWVENAAPFEGILRQLDEYFKGERQTFDVKYALTGTDFQKAVWRELERIPHGEFSSYKAVAAAIGKPNAVRAVGTAVGSNPLSIIVPCHRVLTSTLGIGGYAGGIAAKQRLLSLENISFR
jgi:methylated-DNA-[protein]-cysteine S-methyltransferase